MRLTKPIYLLALFLTFGMCCMGQFSPEVIHKMDSFNVIINDPETPDSERVFLMNKISWKYKYTNIDSSFAIANKAMTIANSIVDKKYVDKINGHIAVFHYLNGDYNQALGFHNKCLQFRDSTGNKESLATTTNNISLVYRRMSDYPQALKYSFMSLDIEKELNNKNGMATSYTTIGMLYKNMKDYPTALANYMKGIDLYIETNNESSMALTFNNVGNVYSEMSDCNAALNYYKKALNIYLKNEHKQGQAMIFTNIGSLFLDTCKAGSSFVGISNISTTLDSALFYQLKALHIQQNLNEEFDMMYTLLGLANIYSKKNDFFKANDHFQKSLEISKRLGALKEGSDALKGLYLSHEITGDYKSAFYYFKEHTELLNEVFNEDKSKEFGKLEAKHEFDITQAVKDAENRKNIELLEEKEQKQRVISYSIFAGLVLILFFSIVTFRRLKITRRQKLIIEDQKEEVETQRDQIEGQKHEIEEKHEEIRESITYAKRIQEAILPPNSLLTQHLANNFVYYKPKDVVAGDFYWLEAHDGIVFFAAADCTGHGVPGAMVSVVCHNALNRAVREFGLRDTGKILDKVRELVLITFEKSEEQMKDGMDICLCAWNKKVNTLMFSGANNPLYLVRGDQLETIKGTKQPIGHVENIIPFETFNIDLRGVDSFYLTTDGYADQFGGRRNKKFGYKQMRDLLLEVSSKPMEEQKSMLSTTLDQWINEGNDKQIDDICMIGVKVK